MENESKRTVVLGASNNPSRFSYHAVYKLIKHHHDVFPVGIKKGSIAGNKIMDIRLKPIIREVDTVTLYMNPQNQVPYYEYILQLNPKRIIFNPGTENQELALLARERQIEPVNECTLVMLNRGVY